MTVNDALTRSRVALALRRVVMVRDCLPRRVPPRTRRGRFRSAPGLGRRAPLLYRGGFSKHRGLEELVAAAALPVLEGARIVFLGYGSLAAELRRSTRIAVADRVDVLAAVPPDLLIDWVPGREHSRDAHPGIDPESAALPPNSSRGARAGVPIIASDLPEMGRMVLEEPAGRLGCSGPDRPGIDGRGDRDLLGARPPTCGAAGALQAAARDRWNLETDPPGWSTFTRTSRRVGG